MCFSLEMSTIMLIFGSLCTAIASKKLNNKIALWVGYFTIMQAIHIVGYLTINDCDNIYNRMASYSNYIHICFQPLFVLIGYLGLMQFTGNINNTSRIRMNYALYVAFAIGIFLFTRLFDLHLSIYDNMKYSKQTKKSASCVWCGKTCSYKGDKHINFSLPLLYPSYITPSLFLHTFGFFILPLFINKFTAFCSLVVAITTYVPAYMFNIQGSEVGTIWCFGSILQAVLVIFLALFFKK